MGGGQRRAGHLLPAALVLDEVEEAHAVTRHRFQRVQELIELLAAFDLQEAPQRMHAELVELAKVLLEP